MMMTVTVNERLRPRDNVFAREFDGEMVLLDLTGGVYYGLDALGTDVWKGMSAGKTLKDLVPDVLATYDVDESRLVNDLITLATDWIDKQLVERVP